MSWLTLDFGNFISVPWCHRSSVLFSVEPLHSGGTMGSKKYLFWWYDMLITFLISLTKCLTKPASWGKGVVECTVHHDRKDRVVRTWVSSRGMWRPQQHERYEHCCLTCFPFHPEQGPSPRDGAIRTSVNLIYGLLHRKAHMSVSILNNIKLTIEINQYSVCEWKYMSLCVCVCYLNGLWI